MSLTDKKYDKKIVIKPWGYEYVAYRNKNILGITFLNINYKKRLHYIVILTKKLVLYY